MLKLRHYIFFIKEIDALALLFCFGMYKLITETKTTNQNKTTTHF